MVPLQSTISANDAGFDVKKVPSTDHTAKEKNKLLDKAPDDHTNIANTVTMNTSNNKATTKQVAATMVLFLSILLFNKQVVDHTMKHLLD